MSASGGYPAQSRHVGAVDLYGQLAGAGAAIPTVPTTAAVGDLPPGNNAILATGIGRTGAGVYTCSVKPRHLPMPILLQPRPSLIAATAKQVCITSFNPTTGALGISVFTPAGVAADLAVGDRLYIGFDVAETGKSS